MRHSLQASSLDLSTTGRLVGPCQYAAPSAHSQARLQAIADETVVVDGQSCRRGDLLTLVNGKPVTPNPEPDFSSLEARVEASLVKPPVLQDYCDRDNYTLCSFADF